MEKTTMGPEVAPSPTQPKKEKGKKAPMSLRKKIALGAAALAISAAGVVAGIGIKDKLGGDSSPENRPGISETFDPLAPKSVITINNSVRVSPKDYNKPVVDVENDPNSVTIPFFIKTANGENRTFTVRRVSLPGFAGKRTMSDGKEQRVLDAYIIDGAKAGDQIISPVDGFLSGGNAQQSSSGAAFEIISKRDLTSVDSYFVVWFSIGPVEPLIDSIPLDTRNSVQIEKGKPFIKLLSSKHEIDAGTYGGNGQLMIYVQSKAINGNGRSYGSANIRFATDNNKIVYLQPETNQNVSLETGTGGSQ